MAENSTPPNAMDTTSYNSGVSMVSALFRLNNRHLRVECTPDSESRDDSEDNKGTIDHGRIPVIRQPPPLTVETGWPSCCGHPPIVYIYNQPMGRPSSLQFADRVSSIDTLTMSGDEASQDSDNEDSDDEDSDDEDLPTPPPVQYVAPPLAPRNISTGPTRPLSMSFRVSTYGSAFSCL
jgi:hypothetical protein